MSDRREIVWRNKFLYEISKIVEQIDSLGTHGQIRGNSGLSDYTSVISVQEQEFLSSVSKTLEEKFF